MEPRSIGREIDSSPHEKGNEVQKLKTTIIVLILIFVVVILLGVLGFVAWRWGWLNKAKAWLTPRPDYQAIFLDNNLLYFGKADNLGSKYITLEDVYYFTQAQKDQQPQLVKFGTQEIHKPKDKLLINRNHVLFVEDLEQDSQVIRAILDFKSKASE